MLKATFYLIGIIFTVSAYWHDPEVVLVDDFEKYQPGDFPADWNGRKEEAKNIYLVQVDSSENHYLSANSPDTDMFIIREAKVDIGEYQYLNWQWKVNELPKGGNESIKKFCDVAASVNVVLVASKIIPKTIKYSWSTTLEKGTRTKSPYAFWPSRADIIVMQSGDSLSGQWITEKRNVFQDYKKLYKRSKRKSYEIDAIVLMTDADNTSSSAKADYDNIYFSKE